VRPDPRPLPYRGPLAGDALLGFLGDRAIPGVEELDGRTFRRSVALPGGGAAIISVTVGEDEGVTFDGPPELEPAARRLLDLDADAGEIDAALAADRALRPLVRRLPGVRVPGAVDGLELVVRAVLGQQVTVRGARTLAGRLVRRLGTPLERPVGAVTHRFPRADRLAEAPVPDLGMPAARARTIHHVAGLVAAGELDLGPSADRDAALLALAGAPGIGPWTCAYVAMRGLGDPDAFPSTDLGVRRAFERLGLDATPGAIVAHAERWRPWRAYAVMRLWLGAHG
jgi:AraC family transcriptional regulator of adaptative response / DNA-3-methyladenine glycosylase II